jgi:hypothetical protein
MCSVGGGASSIVGAMIGIGESKPCEVAAGSDNIVIDLTWHVP